MPTRALLWMVTLVGCFACSVFFPLDGYEGKPSVKPPTDASMNGDSSVGRASKCFGEGGADSFSDNFDEADGGLGARWDDQELFGGTLSLDRTIFVSPPQSLAATQDPSGSGAWLTKRFGSARARIQCELDLRVDRVEGSVSPLEIAFVGASSTNYLLTFYVEKLSAGFTEYIEVGADGGTTSNHGFAPLALGAWAHVCLDAVVPPGGAGSIVVNVDGAERYRGALRPPSQITTQSISVGNLHGYLAAEARFDNVVCFRSAN